MPSITLRGCAPDASSCLCRPQCYNARLLWVAIRDIQRGCKVRAISAMLSPGALNGVIL
jgi:hypothetical protein